MISADTSLKTTVPWAPCKSPNTWKMSALLHYATGREVTQVLWKQIPLSQARWYQIIFMSLH